MKKKEKQNKNWDELSYDTKCWVYKHYYDYQKYKFSRSLLTSFLDWLFGSPYHLEETMIKEFGNENIINFKNYYDKEELLKSL